MDVESTSEYLNSFSKNEPKIFTEILKIKNSVPKSMIETWNSESLYNYIIGNDDYFNIKYIEAEVRNESLNNGDDVVDIVWKVAVKDGCPGDQPEQYIGKDLGGSGFYYNVFPLNSKLNITKWKNDQSAVYNHIKNGQNCFARLFYAINYDINKTAKNYRRPYEIYYHYKLYQNNTEINENSDTGAEIVKETIEGKIINLYP